MTLQLVPAHSILQRQIFKKGSAPLDVNNVWLLPFNCSGEWTPCPEVLSTQLPIQRTQGKPPHGNNLLQDAPALLGLGT